MFLWWLAYNLAYLLMQVGNREEWPIVLCAFLGYIDLVHRELRGAENACPRMLSMSNPSVGTQTRHTHHNYTFSFICIMLTTPDSDRTTLANTEWSMEVGLRWTKIFKRRQEGRQRKERREECIQVDNVVVTKHNEVITTPAWGWRYNEQQTREGV